MDFKTTKFDVDALGLNYHLGFRSSIAIDYWVVNTNHTTQNKKHQLDNNIFRFENDNDTEEVELVDEEEWDEFNDDELIF